MREAHVAAVEEVASDGIDFDGFVLDREDAGYVATTDSTRERRSADELETVLDDVADHVTNWYYWHADALQKKDRWAFLRWLERADELDVEQRYDAMTTGKLARSWGELRISVTLSDGGERRYDVRHEGDADVAADDLDTHADPLDAREIAKHDADGKYRPLKTAPTLRTGWQFADLTGEELVRTVDFLYPATITNWHREREGGLDVSHWTETMERQTGIYGLIETWDRGEGHEHVDWVTEACCVDSRCVKRREWEYDADTELAVDGGDGEFPCREPCSVVVAAARKWTKLESEESRTYEFELTPSEKEQIEEMIDAVADGEADDVREADVSDGANRYRARFLRAKLFDDDGNLGGVETGE